eukprot:5212_1
MANVTNVSECCSECNGVSNIHTPARFSFMYVQMVWGFILIVLGAQFLFTMCHKRKDILKYHDTISSFCAYKHGWENRFLLIFTFIVSANMLSILFEEYNSRYWKIEAIKEWELSVLFLCDCVFIGVFPFVGIFYTRGNHPDPLKHNKDYECPYGNCRIETSEILHMIGAYLFILGLCCTSVVWGVLFVLQFAGTNYHGLGVFSLTWSVLQSVVGIAFVVLQMVLSHSFTIKDAWLPGKEFRQKSQELQLHLDAHLMRCRVNTNVSEERETDDGDTEPEEVQNDADKKEDVIGEDQQQCRLVATKLRYASFVVEALVVVSVIALFIMNTVIRMSFENAVYQNDMVVQFAKEEGSDLSLEDPNDETNAWVISGGIIVILLVLGIIECILYTKRQLKQIKPHDSEVGN